MRMTTAAALLAFCSVTGAAPLRAQEADPLADRAQFIPETRFPALPGRAIMVLTGDTWDLMKAHGRGGHPRSACLSASGGAYRWTFILAEEEPAVPLRVRIGEKADRKTYPKTRGCTLDDLKPMGVTEQYSLVEVEINEGLGSAEAQTSLLVTKLKVLDRSAEYPIHTAKVVGELRRKYEEFLEAEEKEAAATAERIRTEALKNLPWKNRKPQPGSSLTLMYVTWMPDSSTLQVRLKTKRLDGVIPKEIVKSGGEAPPLALPGLEWGLDLGMLYEVGKDGKLLRSVKLPIQGFTRPRDY